MSSIRYRQFHVLDYNNILGCYLVFKVLTHRLFLCQQVACLTASFARPTRSASTVRHKSRIVYCLFKVTVCTCHFLFFKFKILYTSNLAEDRSAGIVLPTCCGSCKSWSGISMRPFWLLLWRCCYFLPGLSEAA